MTEPQKRKRVQHKTGGKKLTKQAERDAADVNVMMRRFAQFGVPLQASKLPSYGDFSNADDYLAQVARIQDAQEQFDALPAKVRGWANNSPIELMRRLSREGAIDELIELDAVVDDRDDQSATPPEETTGPEDSDTQSE